MCLWGRKAGSCSKRWTFSGDTANPEASLQLRNTRLVTGGPQVTESRGKAG